MEDSKKRKKRPKKRRKKKWYHVPEVHIYRKEEAYEQRRYNYREMGEGYSTYDTVKAKKY